jgi:hypothetical protein
MAGIARWTTARPPTVWTSFSPLELELELLELLLLLLSPAPLEAVMALESELASLALLELAALLVSAEAGEASSVEAI